MDFRPRAAGALLLGAVLSACVLVVAEFLTLYSVRVVRGSASVPPVAAGNENHYALIPIAVLAVVLVVAAIRSGERWALGAVALLGLLALLIGLIHDLPDARRTGLVGSLHTGWVRGASSPSVGMYMETLGAVLLLLTAGLGLLFGEQVEAPAPEEPKAAPRPFGVGLESAVDDAAAPAEAAVALSPSIAPAPPARPAPPPVPAPLAPTPATASTNGADASEPVTTPRSSKRRRPATAERSPSAEGAQPSSPTGAKSPPARRSRASSAKGAKATSAGAAKKPATKRSPASSTGKRSPSASSGRTPSSSPKPAKRSPSTPKRSPSTGKKAASPTPRPRSGPKRSES